MESKYKAEQIKVLEGLEGVRKRPAMYIGGTGKDGLHHCVYEVVDNSIDECLAGFCTLVEVTINKDGSVTVKDDGRGIPVGKHPVYKKPALEIALTKLHAGGKFEKSAYEVSGGLHGVGVSVVNALSIKLIATVKREGKKFKQEYKIGKPLYPMKTVGKVGKDEHGTEIQFWPDKEIFSTLEFDFAYLKKRLQEIAFLNPEVKIVLKDEKNDKKETFHYEGGLIEFAKHINKSKTVLHKPIYFKKQVESNTIGVSIQYTDGYNENIFGFVNTINTTEGGTHISGFKTALTRSINDYANKKGLLKNIKIDGNDVREGITAILSLKMKEPQFEGQTKTKLGNSEMKGVVDSMVYVALTDFLEENPSIANKIAQKAVASSKARTAAKKARDLVRRKTSIGGLSGLPGKLADCSSKKTEKTEVYIVEGDSAAGSSKMARNKEFQAILPLKGKILNVEKSNPTRALSSDEIVNLITAIGTSVKETFNLEKLRYSKVIIMTDADVDGQHIRTLLLTFFFRYMPELIENGNIYVAVSPLYRVRKKKDYYVYSDDELKKLIAKLGGKADVQRFKGLGEMNPGQLWDTTMNPKTRILKKINIEDAVIADETFSMLMGDVVAPRRKFIETNANIAEVDI
ncbi:DNA topoisomerase (ATP-hydrolyzing) subunit B [Candidatus Woesearchaeota archaeon]|jgi:DNA gyrase subunit B|nr:DNA topoisomerase (ATP-hydrolyzing) subunit B [Candidatus Woesearchaeota archaeon]